ncbi:MAG TPA: efflux RND transporter periplasmic adaptor subunit, partial [Tahibacter sp.]|nr:efflux RND transporter periplasmic adaptor subunit [Tahibacter sp.]
TVADLSRVWISASVHEKDLGAVFVGQDATVSFDAYDDAPARGTVAYVGEVLDADTRTAKARIAIDNADGRFKPGMFARVTLHGRAHAAAVVPAQALVQSGFDTHVYVELANGVFQPRVVATGARLDDGSVEVRSGLEPGERIVVKDGVLLND